MKPLLLLFSALGVAACLAGAPARADETLTVAVSDAPVPLEVGQTAPAIEMADANGKSRSLADLRGKCGLLLTFFPRCFTGNCTNQVVSLRDSYAELQKLGVEVWAVSTDSADGEEGQRAFGERYHLPFALLPDVQREVCLAYGAVQSKRQRAARMSVLIDKNGKVIWIDKQIDPVTHGADVLKRLQRETIPEKAD